MSTSKSSSGSKSADIPPVSGLSQSDQQQLECSDSGTGSAPQPNDEHSTDDDGELDRLRLSSVKGRRHEIPDSEDDEAPALEENDELGGRLECHRKEMRYEARLDSKTVMGASADSTAIDAQVETHTLLAHSMTPKTAVAEVVGHLKRPSPTLLPTVNQQQKADMPKQLEQGCHPKPTINASSTIPEPAHATANTRTTASPSPLATATSSPKAQRLQSQITSLQSRIADVSASLEAARTRFSEQKTRAGLEPEDPEAVVKRHIKLLQRYNEMKDVGLGLAGLVAEGRGVRVAEVLEEVGMDAKD
ncbi:MAG: hypothetical protein Q9160_003971 [Pyrenula sp. 1 TL-2023]